MAVAGEDGVSSEIGKLMFLTGLSETVNHMLYGILDEGRNNTVDVLSTELERDVLVETRDIVFKSSVERYKEQLLECGIQEVPIMSVKRRSGEKAAEALACDIVDLYAFGAGLVDFFPKGVLGSTSKYIEVRKQQSKNRPGEKSLDIVDVQRRLSELANITSEQSEQMKTMQQAMKDMEANYDTNIKRLESEMETLKTELGGRKQVNSVNTKQGEHTDTQPALVRNSNVTPLMPKSTAIYEQLNSSSDLSCEDSLGTKSQLTGCSQTGMSRFTATDRQQTRTERQKPEPENRGCTHDSQVVAPVVHAESRETPVKDVSPKNKVDGPKFKSLSDFPPLPKNGNDVSPDKRYADVVKTPRSSPSKRVQEGGWKLASVGRNRPNNYVSSPPVLKGVKPERTVTLYVKNIARAEQEDDDGIKVRIKSYIKTRQSIRIIQVHVVHNRFCDDTVGCKITVPFSVQDILMSPDFWPENVECREWSRRRQQQTNTWKQSDENKDEDSSGNWQSREQPRRQQHWSDSTRDGRVRRYPWDSERVYSRTERDNWMDNWDQMDDAAAGHQWEDKDKLHDWWGDDDVREHRVHYGEAY